MRRLALLAILLLQILICSSSDQESKESQKENELRGIIEKYEVDENDMRNQIIRKYLKSAGSISLPGPEYISLGFIACSVHKKGIVDGILRVFGKFLKSIFSSSRGTPLHLILITDAGSYKPLYHFLHNVIGSHLSETIFNEHRTINQSDWHIVSMFPKLRVDFVDILSITSNHRKEIDTMKKHYASYEKGINKRTLNGQTIILSPKYKLDLFYIAPFYAEEFTNLKRLMMFDVDLKTNSDLVELYSYFDKMNSTQMIGVVPDQTAFYTLYMNYIFQFESENLMTRDPEKLRGLNTGVVLYNLEKMRRSEEYGKIITIDSLKGVKKELGIASMVMQVGDQEWMTCVQWRYPHLFMSLPCEWNVQDAPIHTSEFQSCRDTSKIYHEHGKIHEKK